MKRGLKPRNFLGPPRVSRRRRREHPDEEGTETAKDESVRRGIADAAESTPMKRGLKLEEKSMKLLLLLKPQRAPR